ncbi:MAG: hypothetical protein ACRDUA_07490 [Micromonosporaceae bacterium]
MRTTIDLPDDLHRIASSIARDTRRTLSETVADLIRRGLPQPAASQVTTDPDTGFPVVRTGVPITSDDVRALEDDA